MRRLFLLRLRFVALGLQLILIWRSEREKVRVLHEKLRPKLQLQGLKERYESAGLHGFIRHFDLDIINDSGEELDNCLVKILKIEAKDGTAPYTKDLPIALRTQRNAERDGSGRFNLRAKENKIIRLCTRVDGNQREIEFCYERSEPHWSYSLRDTRDCNVVIGLYGAPEPTVERLRVQVDADGKLTVSRMQ